MNKEWLPQNKNTLAIAIVAVAVVLVFGIVKFNQKDTFDKLEISQEKKEDVAIDTDGDGLKDWEENLWGTDINKVDTDNDGVSDFDEVKLNRSPVVYGAESIFKKVDNNNALEIESLTETDKVARSIFSSYLKLKQSGNFNQDNLNIVSDKLISEQLRQYDEDIKYKEVDLKIIENSSANIEDYRRNLSNAINPMYSIKENEILLILNIFNGKEPKSKLNDVLTYANIYKKISEDMLNITTPKDIANTHINMINTFNLIYKSLSGMANMESDPVVAIKSIDDIQTAQKELGLEFEEINTFLIKNGII